MSSQQGKWETLSAAGWAGQQRWRQFLLVTVVLLVVAAVLVVLLDNLVFMMLGMVFAFAAVVFGGLSLLMFMNDHDHAGDDDDQGVADELSQDFLPPGFTKPTP